MLEKNSIDWSNLNHAYGSAEDIPELLEQLETTQSHKILNDLWQRIYHQGSVYSASFASVPFLIDIAEQWQPSKRDSILSLVAGILSGEDANSIRRPQSVDNLEEKRTTTKNRIDLGSPDRQTYEQEIDTLLCLFEESLKACKWSERDFAYLIADTISLNGNVEWKQNIQSLLWGFDANCEHCDGSLVVKVIS